MDFFVVELGAREIDVGGRVLELALRGLHGELVALRFVLARNIFQPEAGDAVQGVPPVIDEGLALGEARLLDGELGLGGFHRGQRVARIHRKKHVSRFDLVANLHVDFLDEPRGGRGDADVFVRALDDAARPDGCGIRRLRRRDERRGSRTGPVLAGDDQDHGGDADEGDVKRGSVKHGGSLSGRRKSRSRGRLPFRRCGRQSGKSGCRG